MRFRLSMMMALVYAVQGAFWPLLAVHLTDLGIPGPQRGRIFATLAMASLAVPLGVGHLVDRVLSGEKLLAAIFLVASGFLVVLALGLVTKAWAIFALFLAFWMIAAPAFALANTIALRHLPRPYEQFSRVRLWGTVGWMSVGWLVTLFMMASGSTRAGQGAYEAFGIAAGLALILAFYSLTLPRTPPLARSDAPRGAALADALELARRPGMAGFFLTAFGVSLTTPFVFQVMPTYFEANGLPRSWITTVLTLGQLPEIIMLAALPRLLDRLGPKGTLTLGLGAWALRYGTLALNPPLWLAVGGIPLHGVGIACFTVAGQIFMDSQAAGDRRAGAQALYMVVTSGLGSLLGCLLAGETVARFHGDFTRVFLVPCVIDGALLVYFCSGFRLQVSPQSRPGRSDAGRQLRDDVVRGSVARVSNLVTESVDG